METVNNAVTAASKMIWGEPAADTTKQTTEPISGETGAGTLSEPYDKGNTDGTSFSACIGAFFNVHHLTPHSQHHF